jgi:hypothetical protein
MKQSGQGVVEYSGALVLSILLFASLIINTKPLTNMFSYIETTTSAMIQSYLP